MNNTFSKESVIISHSADETFSIGKSFGERARSGECYALKGDLGCGKTVFARGFAAGLGISGHITSPTFTILQTYEGGRLTLYHMDVYRIEDEDEMEEVGLDDCLEGDGVCLIEWPERIEGLLPGDTKLVHIEKMPAQGLDERRITTGYYF